MKKVILIVGVVLMAISCRTKKVQIEQTSVPIYDKDSASVTIIRMDSITDQNIYSQSISEKTSDSTVVEVYSNWYHSNDTTTVKLKRNAKYLYHAIPLGSPQSDFPISYKLFIDGQLMRTRIDCKSQCASIIYI